MTDEKRSGTDILSDEVRSETEGGEGSYVDMCRIRLSFPNRRVLNCQYSPGGDRG